MTLNRRFFVRGFGLIALLMPAVLAAQANQGTTAPSGAKIILLGTAGGPPPHISRSQPANLLVVDGKTYLIDAGENVGQQLMKAGILPSRLNRAFITHLHWDHTLGLGYLMASGWMMVRTTPLPIYGPPGIAEFIKREMGALEISEELFRPQTPDRPKLSVLYPAHQIDVSAQSEIYRDDKVVVSATPNSHYAGQIASHRSYGNDRSYSYRFDTAYGSVVFTGDTGPSDNLDKLAKGSDVLVTEICDYDSMRDTLEQMPHSGEHFGALLEHMKTQHLSAEEVGKLAQRAGVKKVILTHFVIGRGFPPASFVAQIRKFYPQGEIVVGQDLMEAALAK